MNAKLTACVLFFAFAVLETAESGVIPGRCSCLKNAPDDHTTQGITTKYLKKIIRLPAGSHCRNEEVIIHFKKGKTLCVNPGAEWVKKLEEALKRKEATSVSSSSSTSTPATAVVNN